ncbi:MAG: hypothetical protein ACI4JK_02195 [Oscillospiraceae bacterium]
MRVKRAHDESLNNQMYECLLDNLLISCYVLNEEFGFGESRIDRYIKAVAEMAKRFDEQVADGVLDCKTAADRLKYQQGFREILRITTKNILPEWFYNEVFHHRCPTRSEAVLKSKNIQRKNAVSLADASRMQAQMQAFSDYLKDKEENQNVHIGNDHNSRCLRRPADPAGRTEH